MANLIRYNDDYFDRIFALHQECFGEEAMTREMFYEEVEHESRVYFVATEGGVPIAYAGAWDTRDDYSIISVAVDAAHRRKGVATQLINRLILDAKSKNIYTITLEVSEQNQSAVNLYRDLGFVVTHTRKDYYKGRIAALIMTLNL
jgi:ribosomal-protein-alanine acetyltransferase